MTPPNPIYSKQVFNFYSHVIRQKWSEKEMLKVVQAIFGCYMRGHFNKDQLVELAEWIINNCEYENVRKQTQNLLDRFR
jgi:hypothetical protein